MSERQIVAILTAILRVRQPELDGDIAARQAVAMSRGGLGERELGELLAAALAGWRSPGPGWLRPLADDVLMDVDFALAIRAGGARGRIS